jgi:hypothetical protein
MSARTSSIGFGVRLVFGNADDGEMVGTQFDLVGIVALDQHLIRERSLDNRGIFRNAGSAHA